MLLLIMWLFFQEPGLDKIFLRSGEVIECRVNEINEYSYKYTMPGQNLWTPASLFLVEKIHLSTGEVREFEPLPDVTGGKNQNQVILTDDKNAVLGLEKVLKLGAGGVFSKKKSYRVMRRKAAVRDIPVVLINLEDPSGYGGQIVYGVGYRLKKSNSH